MSTNELQVMKIISAAGASKAKAFEAISCARRRDYAAAHAALEEAKAIDLKAHEAQTQLITAALTGGDEGASLLTVHAQDHYMCAQLARDMAAELLAILEDRDAACGSA